jgi:hypothetical protein
MFKSRSKKTNKLSDEKANEKAEEFKLFLYFKYNFFSSPDLSNRFADTLNHVSERMASNYTLQHPMNSCERGVLNRQKFKLLQKFGCFNEFILSCEPYRFYYNKYMNADSLYRSEAVGTFNTGPLIGDRIPRNCLKISAYCGPMNTNQCIEIDFQPPSTCRTSAFSRLIPPFNPYNRSRMTAFSRGTFLSADNHIVENSAVNFTIWVTREKRKKSYITRDCEAVSADSYEHSSYITRICSASRYNRQLRTEFLYSTVFFFFRMFCVHALRQMSAGDLLMFYTLFIKLREICFFLVFSS